MRILLLGLIASAFLFACKTKTAEGAREESEEATTAATTSTSKMGASEFADMKYIDMGRQQLALFTKGDYDTWAQQLADNAVYLWSSGDSLVGKKAIVDWWKARRAKYIRSSTASNDIFLPVKVNQPQRGPDLPGIWVLGWHQVDNVYRNGNKLTFWVHTDVHYNDQGQVDRIIAYVDRAPINKAMGLK